MDPEENGEPSCGLRCSRIPDCSYCGHCAKHCKCLDVE